MEEVFKGIDFDVIVNGKGHSSCKIVNIATRLGTRIKIYFNAIKSRKVNK